MLLPRFIILAVILFATTAIITAPAHAEANPTCKKLAEAVVQTATGDILTQAAKDQPELAKQGLTTLSIAIAKNLLKKENPVSKAHALMLLMWNGGADGKKIAQDSAQSFQTETDRAHYYFVLGLYQIKLKNPEIAARGRSFIQQMRDSGKVTFVDDNVWKQLTTTCLLPS